MARVRKSHRAERSLVGELGKGACGESVASHVRVTAAPSFCERRLTEYRRTKSESQERPKTHENGTDGRGLLNRKEANGSEGVYV
jgi:hypothetical protein